jgi:hypothetical protein
MQRRFNCGSASFEHEESFGFGIDEADRCGFV